MSGWGPEGLEDRCSASQTIEAERAEESIPSRPSATVWGVKRALPWLLGVAILTAVLVIGLSQAGGDGNDENAAEAPPFDLRAAKAQLAGAPAPLAALHAQSAQLLEGGVPAFEKRLAALEGTPVVINKWASWCSPCRAEFPAFQRVATARGKEIAFLGVNGHDSTDPAERFLRLYPIPFPSYLDPDEKIAREIDAPANYPITVFVDARGKTAFIHQGGYTSDAALEADIDRYLG
jgi:cytochrome c biogenesis protein CcmG, thiol:disulfide interchange protein DsbE